MLIPKLLCGVLFITLSAFQPKSEEPELAVIEKRLNQDLPSQFPMARFALTHKSQNVTRTEQERMQILNGRIVTELDSLLFDIKRTSSANLIESLRVYTSTYLDRQLARTGYAVQFQGGVSALTLERQLAILRLTEANPQNVSQQVLSIISSYERTAQPGEELTEYPDANDLKTGKPRRSTGDRDFLRIVQPALTPEMPTALRKCRSFPGLFDNRSLCLTSLYDPQLFGEHSEAKALIEVGLTPLAEKDASDYKVMVPDGRTSVYLVRQFHDLVLIYKVSLRYSEVQWPTLDERETTAALIQEDYKNLLRRIEFEIERNKLPWEIVQWQQFPN